MPFPIIYSVFFVFPLCSVSLFFLSLFCFLSFSILFSLFCFFYFKSLFRNLFSSISTNLYSCILSVILQNMVQFNCITKISYMFNAPSFILVKFDRDIALKAFNITCVTISLIIYLILCRVFS